MTTASTRRQRLRNASALEVLAVLVVVGGATMAVVGVPDVPLMWPMYELGVVLPSCGLTRGVVEIFRGDIARAWRFNPASFVVAGGALALLGSTLAGVPFRSPAASPTIRRTVAVAGGVALVALWVHQQLNADFVMHGRV